MSLVFTNSNPEAKQALSIETAQFRASIIEDCKYDVCLSVLKGDNFYGVVKINFNLKEVPSKNLELDFRGQKIASLTINQNLIENKDGDG